MLILFRIVICVLLLTLFPSLPQGSHAEFPWFGEFTDESSVALREVHESIYAEKSDLLEARPVSNLVWVEEGFELKLRSGVIFLEPPIQGVTVGGYFEGDATVSFRPSAITGRKRLEMELERSEIKNLSISSAYIFSLRSDSPLAALRESDSGNAPTSPVSIDTYRSDKSSMRQLDLDLTWLFQNREGPAKGATYVLFPMEEIRTRGSEEARLLYVFNPMNKVELNVFGHREIVFNTDYRFRFYSLVAYDHPQGSLGMVDLERTKVKLSQGTGAETARQVAELQFRGSSGLKGLRLNLTPQMKVTRVTAQNGRELAFLQWRHLKKDPDFDQTLLISLDDTLNEAEPHVQSVTIHSEGVLFEPWFSSFVLIDEDSWCPQPHIRSSDDVAHYELDLTIPKKYSGIGVGERVVDEVIGKKRHLVFRTTKPAKSSTFYFGDYRTTRGKADDIEVELYQQRTNVAQRKNAKFMVTEITNALKVFNRLYVPLDIQHLRVTSTMTRHGRGFEGLILLGGRGTEAAQDSDADIFRAHEVAHQWWGNYVRPKHWPKDRWLSEAFAEFSAMEYYKIRFEDPARAVELMKRNWVLPLTEGKARTTSLTGKKTAQEGRTIYPISSGFNNVYTKGPMVLQMLRYLYETELGEDSFFPMIQDFLLSHKHESVCTDDFQKTAEEHFGSKLDWFFEQWIDRGGLPVVSWKYTVEKRQGAWVARLQAQQEDPLYRLLVPIYFHFSGDKVAVRPWLIEGGTVTRTLRLPSKPTKITLNDNFEALLILHGL